MSGLCSCTKLSREAFLAIILWTLKDNSLREFSVASYDGGLLLTIQFVARGAGVLILSVRKEAIVSSALSSRFLSEIHDPLYCVL